MNSSFVLRVVVSPASVYLWSDHAYSEEVLMEINKLDFSEYHPLDHTLRECRGYPGGWRRHISYDWEFRVGPRWRSRTLCRLGRHDWAAWYCTGEEGVAGVSCTNCEDRPSEAVRKEVEIRERNAGHLS